MSLPDLADDLATAAPALARRFGGGATMWCYAPRWPHHAQHVAVEFVHPVIVGKRALPAVAFADTDPTAALRTSARPGDVLLAVAADGAATDALGVAAELGLESVWIGVGPRPEPGVADHVLWLDDPDPLAPFSGSLVLLYHVLWELTHVCLEHPGLHPMHAPGAGSSRTRFLYPFLERDQADPHTLLADLARSAGEKMAESTDLRAATAAACAAELDATAAALADRFRAGGALFSFGNGGSSSDAAAVAFLCTHPPCGPALPARSLAGDGAVITALGNDIGFDLAFARQLIAYATSGDIALGVTTSGNSTNVLRAFGEAKRKGLVTVAITGYGGGAVAESKDVDHTLIVESDSVHRIQETQAALGVELWARVRRQLGSGPAA